MKDLIIKKRRSVLKNFKNGGYDYIYIYYYYDHNNVIRINTKRYLQKDLFFNSKVPSHELLNLQIKNIQLKVDEYIRKSLDLNKVPNQNDCKKYITGIDVFNMDKKIGYKLKDGCEKYLPALDNISSSFSEVNNYSFSINSNYYNDFKEAQLLDLWFEPVYDNKPDMTISGYKVEFFETYVKFGSVEINKKVFIDLYHTTKAIINYTNTNREVESITIGNGVFYKDFIKTIVEYYEYIELFKK